MDLEEIYNFISEHITEVDTVYEDEDGKHHGTIQCLYDDDLYTVYRAIEDLLSSY